MISSVIEPLKMILGWSPKSACTSIKTGIMESVGIDFEDIHKDFKSTFPDIKDVEIDPTNYLRVQLVRDPIKRFVSTITNRCLAIQHLPYPYMTTRNMLSMIHDCNLAENTDFFDGCFFSPNIKHHFKKQYKPVEWAWDHAFDVDQDLNRIFGFLSNRYGLPRASFGKLNVTKAPEERKEEFYGDTAFAHIGLKDLGKNRFNWVDENMVEMIKVIYEDDYKLIKEATKI